MTTAEQITKLGRYTLGSGLDFPNPKIPFSQWLKPTNLTFSYDFTNEDSYVLAVFTPNLTSNRQSYIFRTTLPTKPTERNTLTFSLGYTDSVDKTFTTTGGESKVANTRKSSDLSPEINWVYLLSVDRPWKLPDMWPFYGRELRIRQNFQLDNRLSALLHRDTQEVTYASPTLTSQDTYTLRNVIGYNVLDNVKINFILEQKMFQDRSKLSTGADLAENRDYYSIKFELGLEAVF
jgi:hypothetical protein